MLLAVLVCSQLAYSLHTAHHAGQVNMSPWPQFGKHLLARFYFHMASHGQKAESGTEVAPIAS